MHVSKKQDGRRTVLFKDDHRSEECEASIHGTFDFRPFLPCSGEDTCHRRGFCQCMVTARVGVPSRLFQVVCSRRQKHRLKGPLETHGNSWKLMETRMRCARALSRGAEVQCKECEHRMCLCFFHGITTVRRMGPGRRGLACNAGA